MLAHGPLTPVAPDVFTVEGALPGIPLRRRMTVVRRGDGSLVIHSAIALDEPTRTQLEALGSPAVLVVPNRWHRIDAAAYKKLYPQLAVYCPAVAGRRVREVVAVDGHYDTFPNEAALRIDPIDGMRVGEGVITVRSGGSTTLVFNDALFNHPHVPGVQGFVGRVLGSTGGPRVTRVARYAMVNDARAFGSHLRRLAETPGLANVVPGHGDVIATDAPGTLARVAATV